jgi:hypothetical protein
MISFNYEKLKQHPVFYRSLIRLGGWLGASDLSRRDCGPKHNGPDNSTAATKYCDVQLRSIRFYDHQTPRTLRLAK